MAVSVPNIVTAVAVEVCRGTTCEPVCKPRSINSMQTKNVFGFV